ncbi:MAG: hypothetical protein SNJ69_09400 [Chloroflexaceae bacterium]
MRRRRIESFLLRIVVSEERPAAPERWRGKIQHITTGAEQQIGELAQIVAFINSHLHAPAEGDPTRTEMEQPDRRTRSRQP